METTQRMGWCLVLLCLVNLSGGAEIQHIGQSRSVSAGGDATAAPDLEPFRATAYASWEYPWEPADRWEPSEYWARAQQNSVLTSFGIVAGGSAEEGGPFYCYGSYSQDSLSDLHVVFALDTPSDFLLTGSLYARGDYGGTNHGWYEATVELSGGEGTVFSASINGAPPYGDPSASWPELYLGDTLALSAGTYVLDIRASARCSYDPSSMGDSLLAGVGGGGKASYEIQLVAVPAPAMVPLILCGLGMMALLRRSILR